jgi:ADP-ribose pyrophosphatase YjhB (NUDIX family)
LEECAVREVEEETGLKNIKLLSPLMITYHTYHEGTRYVLKESHWFNMQASSEQLLIPQTEEDIVEIKWIAAKDVDQYMEKTFASVADVLKTFLAV